MNLQGAEAALVAMVRQSGPALVTKLPRLWERMSGPLLEPSSAAATPPASAPPAQAAAEAQVPSLSRMQEVTTFRMVQGLIRKKAEKGVWRICFVPHPTPLTVRPENVVTAD